MQNNAKLKRHISVNDTDPVTARGTHSAWLKAMITVRYATMIAADYEFYEQLSHKRPATNVHFLRSQANIYGCIVRYEGRW